MRDVLVLCMGCVACVASAAEQRLFPGEEASFSPDGTRIAFQRVENGFVRAGVCPADGGAVTWLQQGPGHSVFPSWGPDGSIVYTFGHETNTAFAAHVQRATSGFNVRIWKNGASTPLTSGRQRDYTASFTPDGRTVYYSSTYPAAYPPKGFFNAFQNASTIYACERGGAPREVVPMQGASSGLVSPRVSPDGRFLVWAHVANFFNTWRIAAARLDRPTDFCLLTPMTMSASAPAWHPNGSLLAFTGFTPGDPGWGVYVMDLATGGLKRLCDGRNPSFAPDGKSLLFDRDGSVWRRDFAAADCPTSADVPAAQKDDEAKTIGVRAKFRFKRSDGLAHVFVAAYPEHALGLQLYFRDGCLKFATRRPDGTFIAVDSNVEFRNDGVYEVCAARTARELVVSVDGAPPVHLMQDDGFLPLSPEPTRIVKGNRFTGSVLSVELVHGWPAGLPRHATRETLFGRNAK